jgi:ABC-type transport system involved in cytochrome bd biosynthesis fused ATPase/permease subunit
LTTGDPFDKVLPLLNREGTTIGLSIFILVLDEFASALDREVEGLILDDLFTIFKHQTVLCITHADHVARRFDRMVHFQRAGQLSDRT